MARTKQDCQELFEEHSQTYRLVEKRTESSNGKVTEETFIEHLSLVDMFNVYSSGYDEDDEVFLEEGCDSTVMSTEVVKPRRRRVSDVVDSLGEQAGSRDRSQSLPGYPESGGTKPRSVPFNGSVGSPPVTPSSGYCSDVCTPSPFTLQLKWARSIDSSPLVSPRVPMSPRRSDQHDARPTTTTTTTRFSFSQVIETNMPVDRDSDTYNMDHPRRGTAVIFNHVSFLSMPPRTGSDIDATALKNTLSLLGFEVYIYNDPDREKISSVIAELARADHSDSDCLMVTVLTHGMQNNYLYSYDHPYSVEDLWRPFTPDICPSLAGKPKLFIIQACRGEKLDGGIRLVSSPPVTQTDSAASTSYKIPKMADFLIAYSTVEGYYSWRNPEHGTWYIQTLCETLQEHHSTLDFLRILTRVARRVSVDFESYNDILIDYHEQKQSPNINTTLIRDLYFTAKTAQPTLETV